MSILDFLKNKNNEEILENKCDINTYENFGTKKSPIYYLKLQEKNNQNKINNQKLDQIANNITQNTVSNYRIVFFCCIKFILLNRKNNKQELLDEFRTMYLKENLEKIKESSKIYETKRKEIIEEASQQIQLIEWENEEDIQESMDGDIDKEYYEIIQNTEDIYIERKYTSNKTRIMYLYKEGLVLTFNIENEYVESNIIKIKKDKFEFIEKFIGNGIKNKEVNDKKNLIMINNQSFSCDTSLFYIVLLLITEQEMLNEKLYFKYELYFSKSEHRMMNNEEKNL